MSPFDPLDDLLAPHPAVPPSPEVLAGTLRSLRRRRRLRRLGGVAVLTATYAAGLLTVLACQPPAPAPIFVVRDRPHEQPSKPPAVDVIVPPGEAVVSEVSAEGAALLYRQAGDLFLSEADPEEAVRCYGNALDNADAIDLEVKSEDSWLLMAIKHARKKERKP